eukprot:1146208-Pelagomonas_calceolata.AAC.9
MDVSLLPHWDVADKVCASSALQRALALVLKATPGSLQPLLGWLFPCPLQPSRDCTSSRKYKASSNSWFMAQTMQ